MQAVNLYSTFHQLQGKVGMKKQFNDLLLRFSQELNKPERDDIEEELWQRFGATITVVVIDMAGFTRLSRLYGVVQYLSMVRRMQLTSLPIIESYRGKVVKFEADNAFARFDSPGDAIRACISLNLAMNSANILTPDELDIHISCGIDHGKCLLPGEEDYFGYPVNCASKLGEDLGKSGQILVTEGAMELVSKPLNIKSEIITVPLGGLDVEVHSVQFHRDDVIDS